MGLSEAPIWGLYPFTVLVKQLGRLRVPDVWFLRDLGHGIMTKNAVTLVEDLEERSA